MTERKIVFTPTFYKNIKKISKKYKNIKADLSPLLDALAQETIGDQIQGLSAPVFKIRLRNSDVKRGKSGGYRIIYMLEYEGLVVLLSIYSKSQVADLPTPFLQAMIDEYEAL